MIFSCTHESCTEYFTSLEQMNKHCRAIHSTTTKSTRQFQCDICLEKFYRKIQLKQHSFAVHTVGNYRYTCEKCGKGYLLESRLKRHEKVSHKIHTCELCAVPFEKWSLLLAHKQSEHANVELECKICNKTFNSRRGLKEHHNIHVNINERNAIPCTFDGCEKFFFRRSNMLAHFKLKHQNRTFSCSYENCGLELSTKQKLEQHIRVIHLGEMGQKKLKTKSKSEVAKRRKDAGVQKVSTASKLFQVILPPEFERAIISGRGEDIQIEYDRIDNDDDDDEEEEKGQKEKEPPREENDDQSDKNQFLALAIVNSSTVELRNSGAVKC